MATRRPSVPKAKFTAGISTATDKTTAAGPASATAAAEASKSSAAPKGGSGESPAVVGGGGAAKTKERRTTSAPPVRHGGDDVAEPVAASPVPARSFSGRLLVLGVAMGAVTLLLAPNVHTYMQQRAEISALRADIATQEEQKSAYDTELARWDDPAYIKQQARDRVSMLMPGETGYWVYGANGTEDADGVSDAASAAAAAKDASAQDASAKDATSVTVQPWVDSLWEAVQESAKVSPEATTEKATSDPSTSGSTAPTAAPSDAAPSDTVSGEAAVP